MIFWIKIIFLLTILLTLTLNLFLNNLMSIILTSEFIIVLLFILYVFSSLVYNINWLIGFSFVILILGGLEIALSFLLLNL